MTADKQAHGGAVGTGTAMVQYSYADGSANHARPTGFTYPNGRGIGYDYGTSNSADDCLSRIKSIAGSAHGNATSFTVSSIYLGAAQVVKSDGVVKMDFAHGTGSDPNAGPLDIFGRVADLRWYAGNTLLEKLVYGYDAASNRIWRENAVAAGLSVNLDEVYQYDGLQQLKDWDVGNRGSGQQIETGSLVYAQEWALDRLGNWSTFKEDSDGNGQWNVNLERTFNKANEVTGDSNIAYDGAGNMIKYPKPSSGYYDLKYDAWNRLVEVKDGAATVATYAYDALNRRTKKVVGSTTRHFYYSAAWQVLEERVGTATTADRQFLWGLRYVDDLIFRDRYLSNDVERAYALQDANFNVTAFVDDTGTVGERYVYTPYGVMTAFDDTWANVISSPMPEYRYAGYRWDGETGFMQVRNRYYDPRLGRFITRDPLEYVGQIGWYSYTNNRPIIAVDPTGEFWSLIVTAAFAIADTVAYATGNIDGNEYAGRMAINAAAAAADVMTLGQGGGLGVRAGQLALRAGRAIDVAQKAARATSVVVVGARATAGIAYSARVINNSWRAYDVALGTANTAVGVSHLATELSACDDWSLERVAMSGYDTFRAGYGTYRAGGALLGSPMGRRLLGRQGVHLDIGGEGRYPGAYNVNMKRGTSAQQPLPIPRLVKGRGERIPLYGSVASRITLENAPIRPGAAAEVHRVARPGAEVSLTHWPDIAAAQHSQFAADAGGAIIGTSQSSEGLITTTIKLSGT